MGEKDTGRILLNFLLYAQAEKYSELKGGYIALSKQISLLIGQTIIGISLLT